MAGPDRRRFVTFAVVAIGVIAAGVGLALHRYYNRRIPLPPGLVALACLLACKPTNFLTGWKVCLGRELWNPSHSYADDGSVTPLGCVTRPPSVDLMPATCVSLIPSTWLSTWQERQ